MVRPEQFSETFSNPSRMRNKTFSYTILVAFLAFATSLYRSSFTVEAQAKIDFVRDIQPIFQTSCAPCHTSESPKAELRLDHKILALKGGISGPVIIPGNSKDSRLLHRVLGLNGEKRMPLGREALSADQIALLTRWIDEGAVWKDES